jgi:hypothetical protein
LKILNLQKLLRRKEKENKKEYTNIFRIQSKKSLIYRITLVRMRLILMKSLKKIVVRKELLLYGVVKTF